MNSEIILTIFILIISCIHGDNNDDLVNPVDQDYSDTSGNSVRNSIPKSLTNKRPCDFLSGTWYNQHGSELILRHTPSATELSGRFRSAVALDTLKSSSVKETRNGHLFGSVTSNGLFAFHVTWENGTAMTAWTGQCETCDQKEVLFTTWILTEKQTTCGDVWKANRVGQDIFKRQRI